VTPVFWRELQAILDQGFTGQIILHCNAGTVVKYEKRETLRPVRADGQYYGKSLAEEELERREAAEKRSGRVP
jgi:hypothetical protein